jgi:hypothetical protein
MRVTTTWFRALSTALCALLVILNVPVTSAQTVPPPQRLQITILEGEGSLNNIKQRTAREPIIQVEDENHKPVAGVAVLFLLPESGPSGTFADGTTTFSTTTDAEGRAVASGLKPNSVSGKFQIRVRVKSPNSEAQAETSIAETNVIERAVAIHGGGHALVKWVVIGGVVAGGVIAGVVATQGGHSTTITPGTPGVGPPQ